MLGTIAITAESEYIDSKERLSPEIISLVAVGSGTPSKKNESTVNFLFGEHATMSVHRNRNAIFVLLSFTLQFLFNRIYKSININLVGAILVGHKNQVIKFIIRIYEIRKQLEVFVINGNISGQRHSSRTIVCSSKE